MEIKTLLFAQAFIVFIAAIFFCVVYRLSFPVKGPGWWVCGYILLTVGLFLLAMRGVIPDILSIQVAHLLIFLDYILFWRGFLTYLGRPGFSRSQLMLIVVLLLFHMGGLFWFWAIHDSIFVRIIVTNIVYSIMNYGIALSLLSSVPLSRSIRLTGWLFIFNGTIFWLRFFLHIAVTPEQNWWHGVFHTGFALSTIGVIVLVSLSMLLLINDALNRQILEQKDEIERNLRFREEVEHLLAHDLKRPLVPIIHLPEKISQFIQDRKEALQPLERIKSAGLRLRDMLNQRLEILQIEQGRYVFQAEKIDMLSLLRQIEEDVSILARQYMVTVSIQVDGMSVDQARPIVFHGAESLVYSMLLNLVNNAVEASPRGGQVVVSLNSESDELIISITNQGEVPMQIRERYARKYVSAGKKTGSGLGAYSARLAAQAHNGLLTLDSSIPGQTTVQVHLPFKKILTDAASAQNPI